MPNLALFTSIDPSCIILRMSHISFAVSRWETCKTSSRPRASVMTFFAFRPRCTFYLPSLVQSFSSLFISKPLSCVGTNESPFIKCFQRFPFLWFVAVYLFKYFIKCFQTLILQIILFWTKNFQTFTIHTLLCMKSHGHKIFYFILFRS